MAVVVFVTILVAMATAVAGDPSEATLVNTKHGKRKCTQGWECNTPSPYCCGYKISDFFTADDFEKLFPQRNSPGAQAAYFYSYESFIQASALFQPQGFCTSGNKTMQMKELAAFFAFVAAQTSCEHASARGGLLSWGLCYCKEMSPNKNRCVDGEEADIDCPCNPGAQYYGRGVFPIYTSTAYCRTGKALNVDLLNHPELIEQNATLAFMIAMWRWMTPVFGGRELIRGWHKIITVPSPHTVFVGDWKPTKKDILLGRFTGSLATTINAMYGADFCENLGNNPKMNNIADYYNYYLDLTGVSSDQAGDLLSCMDQKPFNLPKDWRQLPE